MKQIEQLCRQQLSDVAEIIVENLDDIKCIFIHNSHDECIMTIQGVRDDFFTGNSKTAQEAKIQSNEFLEAFLKTFP